MDMARRSILAVVMLIVANVVLYQARAFADQPECFWGDWFDEGDCICEEWDCGAGDEVTVWETEDMCGGAEQCFVQVCSVWTQRQDHVCDSYYAGEENGHNVHCMVIRPCYTIPED